MNKTPLSIIYRHGWHIHKAVSMCSNREKRRLRVHYLMPSPCVPSTWMDYLTVTCLHHSKLLRPSAATLSLCVWEWLAWAGHCTYTCDPVCVQEKCFFCVCVCVMIASEPDLLKTQSRRVTSKWGVQRNQKHTRAHTYSRETAQRGTEMAVMRK